MKLAKFFDKNGEVKCLITKEDIYKLGLHNPIVGHICMAHEHGNLDWNGALALMVWELAKANEAKDQILIRQIQLAPFPFITGDL